MYGNLTALLQNERNTSDDLVYMEVNSRASCTLLQLQAEYFDNSEKFGCRLLAVPATLPSDSLLI